jgi:hypothetical protein
MEGEDAMTTPITAAEIRAALQAAYAAPEWYLAYKEPPTPGFLCAMLRGRERAVTAATRKIVNDERERIKRDVLRTADNAHEELEKLKNKLAKIRDATGIALDIWTPPERVVSSLRAAESLDIITGEIGRLKRAAKTLTESAQEIQEAADKIQGKEQPNENNHSR